MTFDQFPGARFFQRPGTELKSILLRCGLIVRGDLWIETRFRLAHRGGANASNTSTPTGLRFGDIPTILLVSCDTTEVKRAGSNSFITAGIRIPSRVRGVTDARQMKRRGLGSEVPDRKSNSSHWLAERPEPRLCRNTGTGCREQTSRKKIFTHLHSSVSQGVAAH